MGEFTDGTIGQLAWNMHSALREMPEHCENSYIFCIKMAQKLFEKGWGIKKDEPYKT